MTPAEPDTGRARAHRLRRVAIPGPGVLVVERRPEGGFRWTSRGEGPVSKAEVIERVTTRLHECDEALELCDFWLGQGPEARSPEEQDEILDSRFRYGLERKLLEEFLDWTVRNQAL